jgi:DNA repair exonuclease SbcCD ATPase subunit
MTKPRIKIAEIYLKNYAPFYESMGLKEFYINKRDSPYSLTIIIGANGSGKTYLITELSPELLEHITGRISNRFIMGEEGEKRVHYIVNDTTEYICDILYDKNHKASCFFKRINLKTGENEELNPNGNVSSYQELCQIYLFYNKTFKNVGYITSNVKNVVTMPSIERQQLFSTWLPDTSQFLSASKMVQKKINVTRKEIDNLVSDITKISISSYRENLINYRTNLSQIEKDLLFYRDHISKTSLLLSSFTRYEKELLREHISLFKEKCKNYNKEINKNDALYKSYGSYLIADGERLLLRDISSLREKKASLESNISGVNDKISMMTSSIDRIRNTVDPDNKTEEYNIVSVDAAISNIKGSLEKLAVTFKDTLNDHPEFQDIGYSNELKNAIKQIIAVLLSIFQMANGIIQSCDGFTLIDLFSNNSPLIDSYKKTIEALNEQNRILGESIEVLRKNENEVSKLSIDTSFLSFIPKACDENTCTLVKELKRHMNNTYIDIDIEINNKQDLINQNKEKLTTLTYKIKSIENIIKDVTQINNILFDNKEQIAILPLYIFDKINNPKINEFIDSIGLIVKDLQDLDEYVSLIEKQKVSLESISNLSNIYKILKYNDSINTELSQYLEEEKVLYEKRLEYSNELKSIDEKLASLTNLSQSINAILKQKQELDATKIALETEREKLIKENKSLYDKRTLQYAQMCFKNKEADLVKNEVLMKNEIEKCTSMITNRTVLEQRKELFEGKLRLYELLYAVWNPRTGYPSMLIKDFLDEVTFVTNSSLDNIWGGLIRIKEFRLGENEFKIPIIRGNTILEDITECSTAEQNTLALAISLAIIQVSTSYNIIRIDEADSGFDEVRRQSFLDMITQQLIAAGCEDCYTITHNQYFDNVPCNVILLKGYEYLVAEASLENKYILYRYPSV